jgi:tetratricopeptide (TPR) repeat protein
MAMQGIDRAQRFVGFTGELRSAEYTEWASRADKYAQEGTADRVYADVLIAAGILAQSRPHDAHSYLRRAAQRATSLENDPAFFAAAGYAFRYLSGLPDQPTQSAILEEFLRRPRQGAHWRDLGLCFLHGGELLLERGDREAAEALWEEHARLSELTRDVSLQAEAAAIEAFLRVLDGSLDWVRASDEEIRGGTQVGGRFTLMSPSMPFVHLGRADELLNYFVDPGRVSLSHRAVCLAALGRYEDASAIRHQFDGIESDSDESAVYILTNLLLAAVLGADRETAATLSRRLAHLAACPVAHRVGVSYARLLGEAAALLADPVRARAYYEQALELCE